MTPTPTVTPTVIPDEPTMVLTRMLHAVDALDWATARACFTDEVDTDYTELNGGEPETLAADQLISRWQAFLPGFDATQHHTAPHVVDPGHDNDELRVETHVRGFHHLAGGGGTGGGDVWGVHGNYLARLRRTDTGWRIAALTLQVFYQEGNTDLPAVAGDRATTSPRRPRRPTTTLDVHRHASA